MKGPNMKTRAGTWAVEEPIIASAGGIPYNNAHLQAKEVRIAHLEGSNRRLISALRDIVRADPSEARTIAQSALEDE
jgi:hypothetical protein